jgi:CRISPR system Cascade subunit CasA
VKTFNVLTEPWIPLDIGGELHEVGILEALSLAHEAGGIVDPAPPIEFGLYRLLTALVMDVLQLDTVDVLGDALELGKLPVDRIEAYCDRVGRNRFDLFDGSHPFLQTATDASGVKEQSVGTLFYHLPTGTNVTHFHHVDETDHAVSPAVAARALTSIAPFMVEGGRGYSPSINGAPPWYLQVRGGSLFHTLLLNAHASRSDMELGVPAWRQDAPVVPKAERVCRALLEGLTWQPRVVCLVPGDGGVCTYTGRPSPVLVRRVRFTFGWKYTGEGWTDPNVAYRRTDKGRFGVRPRRGRAPWRDAASLTLLQGVSLEKVRYDRPRVANQLDRLRRDGYLEPEDAPIIFDLYGLDTYEAKVLEWRHDRLAIPQALLGNLRAAEQVQRAHDAAEQLAHGVQASLRQMHPGGAAIGSVEDEALEQFWATLERAFEEFLAELGRRGEDAVGMAELNGDWASTAVQIGTHVLEDVLEAFDTDADALRRREAARRMWRSKAYTVLHREEGTSATGRAAVRRQRKGTG